MRQEDRTTAVRSRMEYAITVNLDLLGINAQPVRVILLRHLEMTNVHNASKVFMVQPVIKVKMFNNSALVVISHDNLECLSNNTN